MYLIDYNKNGVTKDEKIIILTIEEIFKLLIDKKIKVKVLAALKSTTQVFKAIKKKAKKLKERKSFSKVDGKNYIYYLSDNHNSSLYWYIYPKLATKKFY